MFKIVTILILLGIINCMKSKDFCMKNEKLCTEVDTENCEKIKCMRPLSYDCLGYCTTSEKNCFNFLFLQYKILERFKSTIEACSVSIYKRAKPSDTCRSGRNCFRKMNSNTVKCSCPEDRSFVCGKYCTKNSQICNDINESENFCDNNNGKNVYYIEKPDYVSYTKIY